MSLEKQRAVTHPWKEKTLDYEIETEQGKRGRHFQQRLEKKRPSITRLKPYWCKRANKPA